MPNDPAGRARMRLWSKFVDEGLFDGTTELSFSAMFRERMRNLPPEIREKRFRNAWLLDHPLSRMMTAEFAASPITKSTAEREGCID